MVIGLLGGVGGGWSLRYWIGLLFELMVYVLELAGEGGANIGHDGIRVWWFM